MTDAQDSKFDMGGCEVIHSLKVSPLPGLQIEGSFFAKALKAGDDIKMIKLFFKYLKKYYIYKVIECS